MNLVAYALVTLEDTKVFLSIDNNSKDDLLKMLINMATDYIESQTGRRFTSDVHTNETYDGSGSHQIQLTGFPVVSFTKLEVNNASGNVDDWKTVNTSDYWVDNETGVVTKMSDFADFTEGTEDESDLSQVIFNRGKNRYRATYTSGHATVPYDLQFAAMTLVGQMYNTKGGSGIKSESLGDHSITYQDITEVTSGGGGILEDVLSKYRDVPLAN